jgi:hypothetical protein
MAEYIIKDESAKRTHFIQIPNIIDDSGLTLIAFRLYVHLKRVTGENGTCYQSGKTLAKTCNMSSGAVSKAKGELVGKKLIKVETKKDKLKVYHDVTLIDIWEQNGKAYKTPSPNEQPIDSRSPGETLPSLSEQPRSPGETKKNAIKKEPINNSSEQKIMFGALASLCKLDPKLKAGYIGKTAKNLIAAGYITQDLDIFIRWWKTKDFRGIKGEAPTLTNIVDNILKAKQILGYCIEKSSEKTEPETGGGFYA